MTNFEVQRRSVYQQNHSQIIESYFDLLVFHFIEIKCKVNIDTVQSAITYLVKTMQTERFPKEMSFLNSPGNRKIPDLVKDFNLYIDEEGKK